MSRSLRMATAAATFALSSFAASAADLPSTKTATVASPAPFFFVNDNRLTFSYQFEATDPGNPGRFSKEVASFTHFDVWGYGTNFFNIDLLKSVGGKDPAEPCFERGVAVNLGGFVNSSCAGASEIYGLVRSTFGLNQLTHSKMFSYGPLSNISFEVGGDANSENNFVAPAKRDFVAGLEFSFDLPYKGFFNISPLYYKEINHNSFLTAGNPFFVPGTPVIADGNTNFHGTYALETNYYMDLGFLPDAFPISFSGRAALYGPKGTGANFFIPGNIKTTTEFNSEQRLTLDVSKVIWGAAYSHFVDVFVAYRYWQNKFGIDHAHSGVCINTANGTTNHSCTEDTVAAGPQRQVLIVLFTKALAARRRKPPRRFNTDRLRKPRCASRRPSGPPPDALVRRRASSSSRGPTTSVARCPLSNTVRQGRSRVGFSG